MGGMESAARDLQWPAGVLSGHQSEWDREVVKSLVSAGKVRPCFPASDVADWEECPICFGQVPELVLNDVQCCSAKLCTACFLRCQSPAKAEVCPFCNQEAFDVAPAAPPSAEQVFELLKRARTSMAESASAGGLAMSDRVVTTSAAERSALLTDIAEVNAGRRAGGERPDKATLEAMLAAMGPEAAGGPQGASLRGMLGEMGVEFECGGAASAGGAPATPEPESAPDMGEMSEDEVLALVMRMSMHDSGR